MDCQTLAEHITDFLEGDLPEDARAAALDHLSTCEACEVVLAETRSVVELAQNHGRAPLTDEDRSRLLGNVLNEVDE